MYQKLQDVKEYEGGFPLLNQEETDQILGWTHLSTYAAVSNNGFLEAYTDKGTIKHPENYVKALLRCDAGALMMYKGFSELERNAEIFEKELVRLANER